MPLNTKEKGNVSNMTQENQFILSCYQHIADLNAARNIFIVQHKQTHKLYVMKVRKQYNKAVYLQLLQHHVPNTPELLNVLEDEEQLIVIEEYISGRNLQEILDDNATFPEQQALDIICQLCHILCELHAFSPAIIHRDIKPSNIILTENGTIKLLDMNAAKQCHADKTRDTDLIGTVGYAAPEQFGFGSSTTATDIYAVGVLLHMLLTGDTHIPVSGALGKIIQKCTQIDPQARYDSISALLCDCQALLPASKPVITRGKRFYRFLPPGFRTLQPFYMTLSTIGYAMLFYIGFTLTSDNPANVLLDRIAFTAAFLLVILFCGDYLNVQRYFPGCSSRSRLLRTASILSYSVILFLLPVFLDVLLASLITGSIP